MTASRSAGENQRKEALIAAYHPNGAMVSHSEQRDQLDQQLSGALKTIRIGRPLPDPSPDEPTAVVPDSGLQFFEEVHDETLFRQFYIDLY